jgi:hypothetical protein
MNIIQFPLHRRLTESRYAIISRGELEIFDDQKTFEENVNHLARNGISFRAKVLTCEEAQQLVY